MRKAAGTGTGVRTANIMLPTTKTGHEDASEHVNIAPTITTCAKKE